MTAPEHDDLLDSAGAWVLGALPDDEAERFEAHLAGCAECRDEVAHLQDVIDVLPLAAPPAEPSPALKARVMEVVEREAELLAAAGPEADRPVARERRGWWSGLLARPWLAAAGATALIAVGVAGGVLVSGGSNPISRPVTGSGMARVADGSLVQDDGHAELRVRDMPAPPDGRVYQVWILRGGAPQPDAVFTVDRRGRGSVGIRGDVEGAKAILVTAEPAGGSSAPTSPPILKVTPA